jgi:hypothetical protein
MAGNFQRTLPIGHQMHLKGQQDRGRDIILTRAVFVAAVEIAVRSKQRRNVRRQASRRDGDGNKDRLMRCKNSLAHALCNLRMWCCQQGVGWMKCGDVAVLRWSRAGEAADHMFAVVCSQRRHRESSGEIG